jgi:hypothetical protein
MSDGVNSFVFRSIICDPEKTWMGWIEDCAGESRAPKIRQLTKQFDLRFQAG